MDKSSISLFSRTSVKPNVKHFDPFGFPVYVLQAPLQSAQMFPRWAKQSRIEIFCVTYPTMFQHKPA